jgi:hypothetical protein
LGQSFNGYSFLRYKDVIFSAFLLGDPVYWQAAVPTWEYTGQHLFLPESTLASSCSYLKINWSEAVPTWEYTGQQQLFLPKSKLASRCSYLRIYRPTAVPTWDYTGQQQLFLPKSKLASSCSYLRIYRPTAVPTWEYTGQQLFLPESTLANRSQATGIAGIWHTKTDSD